MGIWRKGRILGEADKELFQAFHVEHSGIRQIVGEEELPLWRARSPDPHGGAVSSDRPPRADCLGDSMSVKSRNSRQVGANIARNGTQGGFVFKDGVPLTPSGNFAEVEFSYESRQNMRVFKVVIVVGPVKVCGHDAQIPRSVLAVERLTQFDAGDPGDRVGFIGRLEKTGQEVFLLYRLRCESGIDAGASQEENALYAGSISRFDLVCLDLEVRSRKSTGQA